MAGNTLSEMGEVEIQKYREAWRLFDINDTGDIALSEFKEVLEKLGINAAKHQIYKRLAEVDLRQNGVINFEEFMQVVITNNEGNKDSSSGSEMQQMFQIFDPDNKGYVTKVELGEVLKKLGLPFTQQQIDLMMEYADIAGDGRINYNEFLKINKMSY